MTTITAARRGKRYYLAMKPTNSTVANDNGATTRTEQLLAFDPTLTDVRFVSAAENSSGTIDHDDRGQPRWKWHTEMQTNAAPDDGTFDHLKALTHVGLRILDDPAEPAPQSPLPRTAGFNPYDSAPLKPKPARRK